MSTLREIEVEGITLVDATTVEELEDALNQGRLVTAPEKVWERAGITDRVDAIEVE